MKSKFLASAFIVSALSTECFAATTGRAIQIWPKGEIPYVIEKECLR